MNLRVLTFNIHHGKGRDKKLDLQRISHIIKTANADIIGLNEVDRYFSKRSHYLDQAKFLGNELKINHAYGPALTIETEDGTPTRQFGNALLTRFPILEVNNHPFDFLPRITEDRALLEVKLRAGEEELTVFVTHLSLAPFQHKKQSAFIINKIIQTKGPAMIMGDWNMTPASRTWKVVTESLTDAWAEVHPGRQGGYTFPSKRPFRRLDYIFVTRQMQVIDCEVIKSEDEASDHLPFIATIELVGNRS
ncbi:endonuclease/exonuclease/phosphatase family protein [Mesobacillus zeae]|uniref:Endonuclease n=1 Tax=Mesobacillus zeae TaxID=1917180 RepID=A0A398B7E4_9BACI|nr:endonuclease/exonuclease/phosphatase family protein [Mesobacillus zeae]RID85762.1 endonuclease [Mesobacillus zeae]